MIVQTDEKIIYDLIKKAVSEAVDEKFNELKINLLPIVDDKEMEQIDLIFDSPGNYNNQELKEVDI